MPTTQSSPSTKMAQLATVEKNGAVSPESDSNDQIAVSVKRKRGSGAAEAKRHVGQRPTAPRRWPAGAEGDLVKSYFDVLTTLDVEPSILKRPLSDASPDLEPDAKRKKQSEPPSRSSISDKVVAGEYADMEHMAGDILASIKAALSDLNSSDDADKTAMAMAAPRIRDFKDKAVELLNRERAYPHVAAAPPSDATNPNDAGEAVLSIVGYAPQERCLFSSLPLARATNLSQVTLPQGVSISRVVPSTSWEKTQTLGELFSSPRPLPPLQPPKQPKTQAKSNVLDFYHPELTDTSKYRTNCYYTTKLSAGHYLDYSNATPSSQTKTKQRERAQSLAGKKPSASELEMTEMDALFRGAFSSFSPCKDDTAAVVPSSVAGRIWWQKTGQRSFQRMIEVECYGGVQDADGPDLAAKAAELDESAVQEAIDNWDDSVINPTLEDVMGLRRDQGEKEADEILDDVSNLIETLASYQRIRNLTLPNSQNRQSSDPVTGDMLATASPQPSEEEHATYQMLRAQLALIIRTLPPYAVAKLNGDQLDDLLISTKIQVQTDQYRGVMEDDVTLQARLRAQQQAAHAATCPGSQRTPSISTPYGGKYQASNQYATSTRATSYPQQYYRPSPASNYQQPRNMVPSAHQSRAPQPSQYARPNGFPNQYATQLAKSQTPYGHQNVPLYAGQSRPGYAQMPLQPQQQQPQPGPPPQHPHPHQQQIQPQPGNPNVRYAFPHGYPQQQETPGQPGYGPAYTNGSDAPPRTMSPQVPQRQPFSPSPVMQQNQRFPSQGNAPVGKYSGSTAGQPGPNPGLTGYHTVIPEAQQQRILDQAKARVAAQERTAMFADKIAQAGASPVTGPGGLGGDGISAALATTESEQKPSTPVGLGQASNGTPGVASVPPQKVTPVLPVTSGTL